MSVGSLDYPNTTNIQMHFFCFAHILCYVPRYNKLLVYFQIGNIVCMYEYGGLLICNAFALPSIRKIAHALSVYAMHNEKYAYAHEHMLYVGTYRGTANPHYHSILPTNEPHSL